MPRMMEKTELLRSVVDASQLDKFWLDTVRPSHGQAVLTVPESLLDCDVQVVYVPVSRHSGLQSAKERLHALMARTPKQEGAPYVFRRADAYDEELA